MESGLEGRNNEALMGKPAGCGDVSMESGLEGRNNSHAGDALDITGDVSMESGLEGRNNPVSNPGNDSNRSCLNGVRPRRPEQSAQGLRGRPDWVVVSMESGLEGRNNGWPRKNYCSKTHRLNGVRPRRPEQSYGRQSSGEHHPTSQWSPA